MNWSLLEVTRESESSRISRKPGALRRSIARLERVKRLVSRVWALNVSFALVSVRWPDFWFQCPIVECEFDVAIGLFCRMVVQSSAAFQCFIINDLADVAGDFLDGVSNSTNRLCGWVRDVLRKIEDGESGVAGHSGHAKDLFESLDGRFAVGLCR